MANDATAGWRDVGLFFALACGITWALDVPLVLAWFAGVPPPAHAMAMAGLGAFGPTIAALVVAGRRGELGAVFGRWRTGPLWLLIAVALPGALHLIATLIEVGFGGTPRQWFYPPVLPEHFAGMVVFSIAEEFGWRGYAYPRISRLQGPIHAALITGAVWGVWHLGMMFGPERAAPTIGLVGFYVVTLALASVVMAWVFERGDRSMAVAIAFHMGAHLDNTDRAPAGEVRLEWLRFAVLAIAAVLAAWSLARRPGRRTG